MARDSGLDNGKGKRTAAAETKSNTPPDQRKVERRTLTIFHAAWLWWELLGLLVRHGDGLDGAAIGTFED
jgi:hypothetical protein